MLTRGEAPPGTEGEWAACLEYALQGADGDGRLESGIATAF